MSKQSYVSYEYQTLLQVANRCYSVTRAGGVSRYQTIISNMSLRTYTLACALLAAGLSPIWALGQPAPADTSARLEQLTLHQAVLLFTARNREVQLAQRGVESAEAALLGAAARPNPNLYVNATQIGNQYPQGYDSGRLDRRADTTIGISQMFERGGKRELRMAAADRNLVASRGDYADMRRLQKVALHAAFYDLLAAQERVRTASETAGLFQKTVDAAEFRLKAGDIARADVARIQVDALRAQNDARLAQADQQRAQTALAYIIGAERDAARIHVSEGWPEVAAVAPSFDIDAGLSGRGDVQAAQARVQAAEKSLELARSLRTRDVTAMVQFDRTPWNPLANPTSANTVGVGISIPLFTNYYFAGEIRGAEVDLQAARENLERVRALARGEIASARAALDGSAERVRRFRESLLGQAQRAADAAEYAYVHGALGVMDLLDARRQLYATQLEASSTQAEYAKALAAWQAAIAPAELNP